MRFIDNFSQGTRGSASAEYFLRQEDCSVIFLHRLSTLRPFLRHFSHTNFLEILTLRDNTVQVDDEHAEMVKKLLLEYDKVKANNRLIEIPFTTLTDYLWLLKIVCDELNTHCGKKALLYLAAAVSDFYIPSQDMSEHKIQSSQGAPKVELKMVPKMLAPLVKEWAPQAFVVSFKLETDETILLQKAEKALDYYQHKVVVANLLHTRKERVIVVYQDPTKRQVISMSQEELVKGQEIEEKIVARLIEDFIYAS